MGYKYTEPVILNLEIMLGESRPLTPMICFLSIGSDPTPYIEQLAKRVENKCKCISMGQGQEVHARKLMTQAMSEVEETIYDRDLTLRTYGVFFCRVFGLCFKIATWDSNTPWRCSFYFWN